MKLPSQDWTNGLPCGHGEGLAPQRKASVFHLNSSCLHLVPEPLVIALCSQGSHFDFFLCIY